MKNRQVNVNCGGGRIYSNKLQKTVVFFGDFMKKVIVILIIFSLIFTSFLILKKEEKANKNISVILETEEGNIKSNTFPNKNDYEYLNTECENTSDFINTIFNENTWKLNLSVEEKSIDGNFNCTVYFKEKSKLAV